ncbi:MAG: sugar phosphate isomerase/epimerase family protein [Christensenellales bacterium]
MKVSCLPVSFFADIMEGRMTLAQWIRMGRECGLDGVDISTMLLKNHTPKYLGEVTRMLEEEKIPVVMAVSSPDFSHPDERQRKREMEYLRCDIAVCSQLHIPYLRVLAGQDHRGLKRQDGIRYVVENCKEADGIAKDYGVQLVYENHAKSSGWDTMDFSYDPAIFLEIMDGLKDTSIGVNFDGANTVTFGGDPIPLLKTIFPRIKTVHVADAGQKGKMGHVVIGTGVVPLREIFSYLKTNGYDGWLCIEEGSNTGRYGVQTAVDYVRNTWAQV